VGTSANAVNWRMRRIRLNLGLGNPAQLAALLTHLAHEAGLAGAIFSTGRLACGHNREEVK
jgi:hypothetical protein